MTAADEELDLDRLKERQDELDFSRSALAERMRISRGHLNNILNGTAKPSRRVIYRFSRELDLPIQEFWCGKRTPQGDPSEPPRQPTREPVGPARRQDKETQTGPKRAA
ncbi:helix-turn-helix domain-containing protein [Amycolatopsis sp. NPDC004368]